MTALIAIVLAVLLLAVTREWLVLRGRLRQRGLFRRWPIRRIGVEALDPRFAPDELGPTLLAEVRFLGRGTIRVPGGTSDTEAWILAALAQDTRLAFEFGTCTGKTAYLWARNQPADGRVVTLTLGPDQLTQYQSAPGDAPVAEAYARAESACTRYLYSGSPVEARITQLLGDSKAFDATPYANRCDLVFVDGSHAYSYVVSDSDKALRMVRPGGLVLWHDYSPESPGVFRALNELSRRVPLVHVQGTTLVAYRREREAVQPGRPTAAVVLLLGALMGAVPAVAPAVAAQGTRVTGALSVELAELRIVSDTQLGVSLLKQPAAGTREAKNKDSFVWLRFDPDSALEWINSAVAAIRTPVAGTRDEGIQWSRTLVPAGGKGAVALGRTRKKGALQKTHWLAIADSLTGWRFELSGGQADSLLRLLLVAGGQSRLDTSDAAPLAVHQVDVPVRVVDQPAPGRRGRGGRVLAQYVVGADGRAEPASFAVFFASDTGLIAAAWEVVRASTHTSAIRGGRPVRQVVTRSIDWPP